MRGGQTNGRNHKAGVGGRGETRVWTMQWLRRRLVWRAEAPGGSGGAGRVWARFVDAAAAVEVVHRWLVSESCSLSPSPFLFIASLLLALALHALRILLHLLCSALRSSPPFQRLQRPSRPHPRPLKPHDLYLPQWSVSMAAASIAMVARLLEILTPPASKENHHQDPEEFYVKQDRIGA